MWTNKIKSTLFCCCCCFQLAFYRAGITVPVLKDTEDHTETELLLSREELTPQVKGGNSERQTISCRFCFKHTHFQYRKQKGHFITHSLNNQEQMNLVRFCKRLNQRKHALQSRKEVFVWHREAHSDTSVPASVFT